ncbi:TetR/AcrR family transcriptional regulator [Paenibacillus methanolicus]|uniref:AcrR family transcriptional regulator n=1 Tax=Paenibacillus methanolicus TaxID=582686 RepID=A0A5S5C449_9BACL|nr:TetR/AcrR family transcriptional regulator [Paenibacillus methanolicus]TYP74087.1 AcrR family transcriptional regulator [Paenibacillus methanolicus]
MEETKRRPGRPPKQTEFGREFLLNNALIEFSKNGYEGTSLRTIASLSHVDVALISHHFGPKLELWKAVVDYLAGSIKERAPFRQPFSFADQEDAQQTIAGFVEDFVNFSFEHPHHSMFLAHEAVAENERSEYLIGKMLQPTFRELKPFIEGCMQAGAIRQQDPALFFLMLINSASLLATMPHYAFRLSGDLANAEAFKEAMKRSVMANFFS